MIRAILFDLGDTLLNFEPMDMKTITRQGAIASHQRLQQAGVAVPPIDRYRRSNIMAVRLALVWSFLRGRELHAQSVMHKHAVKRGAPDSEQFMNELAWDWYKAVVPYSSIEPDLISTLQTIYNNGIKIGIVSNTFVSGKILDRHLEMMGLLEHLPLRIYSSEVGYKKPHPIIYHTALEAIKSRPQETLFVGDVMKNDVIGPAKLGMKTALKQKPGRNYGKAMDQPDYVIQKISDLLPILFPKVEVSVKSIDPIPQAQALHR